MAIENFTTYDHGGNENDVTVIAAKVSWNDLDRNQTEHVSDSKGVAHFSGDFTHKFECSFSDAAPDNVSLWAFWALTNAQIDFKALIDAGADAHLFTWYGNTATPLFMLRLLEDGGLVSDQWTSPTSGITYFVTVSRDDDGGVNNTGQVTAEIHTGDYHPAGVHKDLLTVDCSVGEQNDFEYVCGLLSFDDNTTVNRTGDGFIQNLDLGVVAAPSGQVITIIMSKLLFPFFWLKQGKRKRRDFLKNSLLAMIGIR